MLLKGSLVRRNETTYDDESVSLKTMQLSLDVFSDPLSTV